VSRNSDAVRFYLNAAGKIPLLTPAEEIELGRKVQAFMRLLETNPDGPYDMQEKRIIRSGKQAKERMILANLRLVMVLAKKYIARCRHLCMEDLLQEGVIGLMRGVEKFDPERGFKFSTYSYWWIRQGIARAVAALDRTVKLPNNAVDCLLKARYFSIRFAAENGRQPTVEEIAEECGVGVVPMRNYLQHARDTASLDAVCLDGDGSSILELIADKTEATPWEYIEAETISEQRQLLLQTARAALPIKQQEVLQLRFALTDEEGADFFPRSQPDTARALGISVGAVQERERIAIRNLKLQLTPA
jgi:RNA polymerase primary sigma factor